MKHKQKRLVIEYKNSEITWQDIIKLKTYFYTFILLCVYDLFNCIFQEAPTEFYNPHYNFCKSIFYNRKQKIIGWIIINWKSITVLHSYSKEWNLRCDINHDCKLWIQRPKPITKFKFIAICRNTKSIENGFCIHSFPLCILLYSAESSRKMMSTSCSPSFSNRVRRIFRYTHPGLPCFHSCEIDLTVPWEACPNYNWGRMLSCSFYAVGVECLSRMPTKQTATIITI